MATILETAGGENFTTTYRLDAAPAAEESNLWYELAKRCIDVMLASLALLLLFPLLAILGLLIKMDGGPVLFAQTRVGRRGRHFRCYKLRSMICGADRMKAELMQKSHHSDPRTFKMAVDPRVTTVGRLIRKTSLDEVPQLWNVIIGDMSLVGPRPPVPSEVSRYSGEDFRRLEVRPGLTCIWQISGRGDIPFHQQVKLDIDYIEQRSLWLDAKLMLQTIPAVISGRGAY
jgi:lipopolysaccharide/colanic/teichoic acid biosynthesis glycosyltransferase